MLRLKWGGRSPDSCQHLAPLGARQTRGGKLKAGSIARRPSAMPVAKPGEPSGVNSTIRVDLPLARGTGLRVQCLFTLLLPLVENSIPRRPTPNPGASPSKQRNGARFYRATRVPSRERVGPSGNRGGNAASIL